MRGALSASLLSLLFLGPQVGDAHDRCFATASADCSGSAVYEMDFPRANSNLNESACAALAAPCDAASLIGWIEAHAEGVAALSGSTTAATFRGTLLERPQEKIDLAGRFTPVAGKMLHLCYHARGAASPLRLRSALCASLPAAAPSCSHGTLEEDGQCRLPVPVARFDPESVLRTLKQAEVTFGNAQLQLTEKSEMEAEGDVGAARPPAPQPPPGIRNFPPNGRAVAPEVPRSKTRP